MTPTDLLLARDPVLWRHFGEIGGDRCRECGKSLGAGYLCDDCDTVEGWNDE